MLVEFMIVRTLLPLVRLIGRLPAPVGRGWLRCWTRPVARSTWWTMAGVYRFPIRHFEHHRRQLTLPGGPGGG